MRVWVIGSHAQCDVVVDSPIASARHCQLTRTDNGFLIEDLNSTNGTFLDGVRLTSARRVEYGDLITLGRSVPMPWPPEILRLVTIGRVAGNELVLDDPRVSSRHARLILIDGDGCCIEDLGSANGTFLNRPDHRVTTPAKLSFTDTIYFGTFAVPASRLLGAITPTEPQTALATAVPDTAAGVPRDSAGRERSQIARPANIPALWWLVLTAKAILLSILIVIFAGGAVSSLSFALALYALWLGSSVAVLEAADSRSGRAPPKSAAVVRIGILASACATLCALSLGIVSVATGVRENLPAMWGIMTLASGVGASLGLVVHALTRRWIATVVILAVLFVPLVALGGRIWPLGGMNKALRLAAALMPSRWAFEGLLLPLSEATDQDKGADRAEHYFPAETVRMGWAADAMALGFMFAGLFAFLLIWPAAATRAP